MSQSLPLDPAIAAPSPQDRLIPLLFRLAAALGLCDRVTTIVQRFRILTADSLARWPSAGTRRFSTLTRDGLPFEVSVSVGGAAAGGLRYGVEVGRPGASFHEKVAAGVHVTHAVLKTMGATHGMVVNERLCSALFARVGDVSPSWRFATWHAVVHTPSHPDTLKVYYSLRPFTHDPSRAMQVISALTGFDLAWAVELIPRMPCGTRLAFVCVEYQPTGVVKVKLYWNLTQALPRPTATQLLTLVGSRAQTSRLDAQLLALCGETAASVLPNSIQLSQAQPGGDTAMVVFLNADPEGRGDAAVSRAVRTAILAAGFEPHLYNATLEALADEGMLPNPQHQPMSSAFGCHTVLGLGATRGSSKFSVYLTPGWAGLARHGSRATIP